VDLFLYDLKLMDPDKHLRYTGVSNDRILYNLTYLARAHSNVIVRVPVIPGVNAAEEDMVQLGDFVASLKTVRAVHLLPYHNIGVDKYRRLGREYGLCTEPPTPEYMEALAGKLRGLGLNIRIGG
ncbi:MAG TPA: glycyl-radical enzyme activating protein, partial [Verrucomicrobiae bacterium]|nr:glycyl-radical enzyme activating protein [Verrucomicrobiae bacterium]